MLVASWSGQPVRWLARETAVAPGPGTFTWDARDANGQLVPDGQYLILERVRYGSRWTMSTAAGVRIDTTKPSVDNVVLPKKTTAQLAMKPADRTSGLATVALTVDGKKVAAYKAKGGGLHYRPKKGWKAGRTYKWRAAVTDNAGNALVKTGKFKVAAKKKPKRARRR